ncbi:SGNH hydrolase domain-containing protein [Aeromicrobium sp. 179-A 4D2 NHS]|uniref:SGNH hydrolase domain-containing protein n=1 Tax=Aeromicrobium sp. 179-A 4D2 NHS TaxID=3142375 RepID=UPI00399F2300
MSTVTRALDVGVVAVTLLVAAVLVAFSEREATRVRPVHQVSASSLTLTAASATPRCYGAASMTRKRCHNPALVGRLTPSTSQAQRDQTRTPGKQCYRRGTSQTTMNRGCSFGTRAKGRPHVILVGDSHARVLLTSFITLAGQGRISLEAQVRAGCSWVRSGLTHRDKSRIKSCREYRRNLHRWLLSRASTTDVIVTTGYARQVAGSRSKQIERMRDTWRPLIKRGVRIVGVSDNPRLSRDPQRCLKKYGARKGARKCGVSFKEGTVRDPFIEGAKAVKGATALDLRLYFCRKGFCPAVIGGVNVYRDITHVTRTYATTLTPFIAARLKGAGVL